MSQLLEMLGLPLLVCLMMSGILAYAGMHVLKREIIFIDITLAQVAAMGSILAHLAFGAHEETLLSYAISLACVLVLAAFYALLHKRPIQLPIEAIIGVSFAIAAAAGVFLISLAPTEMHADEMLAGSLLWIQTSDVVFMLVVFAVTGLCFYLLRRPLYRVSEGYREGPAAGAHGAWWDFVFYALVGIVITTAVKIAGVLVVFGFLIMPATISTVFSSRWGIRLLIAWAVGAVASMGGLAGAYYLDFSVGPVIALCMGILLAVVALLAKLCPVLASGPSRIEGTSVSLRSEES
jgi:zinc/manganese transport system permease protein